MKSAYELAMERLSQAEPTRKLTEPQKEKLAEINSLYQSKLAERETFLKSLIAQAEGKGDYREIEELRQQLARDLASIKEEWETRKAKIREES